MRWAQLSDEVALLQFPLRALGIDFGRNTTLLRLRDGRVIVHSSGPFRDEDVADMRRFGEPAWLLDATLAHDTFAKEARHALPNVPYFAPEGFAKASGVATRLLTAPPPEWLDQVDVLPLDGLRLTHEHAFFHRASRTLVLADLLFHFSSHIQGWPRFFVRHLMGLPQLVGISAFFRMLIRDKAALASSMRAVLEWNFGRIVVAHGAPVVDDAKSVLIEALRARKIIH
jgi:hypothetical protein